MSWETARLMQENDEWMAAMKIREEWRKYDLAMEEYGQQMEEYQQEMRKYEDYEQLTESQREKAREDLKHLDGDYYETIWLMVSDAGMKVEMPEELEGFYELSAEQRQECVAELVRIMKEMEKKDEWHRAMDRALGESQRWSDDWGYRWGVLYDAFLIVADYVDFCHSAECETSVQDVLRMLQVEKDENLDWNEIGKKRLEQHNYARCRARTGLRRLYVLIYYIEEIDRPEKPKKPKEPEKPWSERPGSRIRFGTGYGW